MISLINYVVLNIFFIYLIIFFDVLNVLIIV